jgi:hypothetical protein
VSDGRFTRLSSYQNADVSFDNAHDQYPEDPTKITGDLAPRLLHVICMARCDRVFDFGNPNRTSRVRE